MALKLFLIIITEAFLLGAAASGVSPLWRSNSLTAVEYLGRALCQEMDKNFWLFEGFLMQWQRGSRTPSAVWSREREWARVSVNEVRKRRPLRYFRLDTESSVIDEPFTKRLEFWDRLLKPAG